MANEAIGIMIRFFPRCNVNLDMVTAIDNFAIWPQLFFLDQIVDKHFRWWWWSKERILLNMFHRCQFINLDLHACLTQTGFDRVHIWNWTFEHWKFVYELTLKRSRLMNNIIEKLMPNFDRFNPQSHPHRFNDQWSWCTWYMFFFLYFGANP